MLKILLRLLIVLVVVAAGAAVVVRSMDSAARAEIAQAAQVSVGESIGVAHEIAMAHDRPPSAEALLDRLAGLQPGAHQRISVVLPDGSLHAAAVGPTQVAAADLAALPLSAGAPLLVELSSPERPGWVGTLPLVQGDSLVGTYVLVEHYGERLAAQSQQTLDRLGLILTVLAMCVLVVLLAGLLLVLARALAARWRPLIAARWGSGGRAESARPLGAVVIEGFGSRLAFGLLSFALPLYAYSLGMSLAQIGLLLSTNMVVAIVLKPAMGAVIDRIGVRGAYLCSLLLRTAVLLTLIVAPGPAWLFVARALHGVSIALRDPAAATILAALGGKKAVAQRFAWYQTVKSVAGSAGSFGAGVLLTLAIGNYAVVFAVAALLSAAPIVVVVRGLRGPAVEGLRLPRPPRGTPMPADLKRALLPYAGLGAMMTGTAYLMANLLPVLAVEYMGLAPAAAASLYLVKSVVSLTGPAWGWVSDHAVVDRDLGTLHVFTGLEVRAVPHARARLLRAAAEAAG